MNLRAKAFAIPRRKMGRLFTRLQNAVGTVNSRKFGRLPRGCCIFAGFDVQPISADGGPATHWFVTVWLRNHKHWRLLNRREKVSIYRFVDIGNVLKACKVASRGAV
jgi:hypothetical protein